MAPTGQRQAKQAGRAYAINLDCGDAERGGGPVFQRAIRLSGAANWYSSRYGLTDEIAAANLLTADVVKQAARLVKTGKTYAPLRSRQQGFTSISARSIKLYNPGSRPVGRWFTSNDGVAVAYMGVGTQLNGIGHIGIDKIYYSGNRAADFVTAEGVTKLGMKKEPQIVKRGVVLDMTDHYGKAIVPGNRVQDR